MTNHVNASFSHLSSLLLSFLILYSPILSSLLSFPLPSSLSTYPLPSSPLVSRSVARDEFDIVFLRLDKNGRRFARISVSLGRDTFYLCRQWTPAPRAKWNTTRETFLRGFNFLSLAHALETNIIPARVTILAPLCCRHNLQILAHFVKFCRKLRSSLHSDSTPLPG